MRQISREQHRQIVQLLSPLLAGEGERRALLSEVAGYGSDDALIAGLDFTGAVAVFVPHLVDQLVAYGTLQTGEPALLAVLDAAKGRVGMDRAVAFDTVIAQLRTPETTPAPSPQPEAPAHEGRPQRTRNLLPVLGGILTLVVSAATIFAVLPDTVQNRFWLSVGLLAPTNTSMPTAEPSVTATPTRFPTNTSTALPTLTPTILPPSVTAVAPTDSPVATIGAASGIAVATVDSGLSGFAPAQTSVMQVQPCTANVVSQTAATTLNVVRSDDSNRGLLLAPVNVGETVTVLEQSVNGTETWYRINYGDDRIGWITAIYLQFETQCQF